MRCTLSKYSSSKNFQLTGTLLLSRFMNLMLML